MLLSDEEISDLWVTELDDRETVTKFARAIEAALLAKLASAELPANAPHITRRIRACESEVPALIVFEHAWRQAYAQGAVAQLSAEPLCHVRDSEINRWNGLSGMGFSGPLYKRKEASK